MQLELVHLQLFIFKGTRLRYRTFLRNGAILTEKPLSKLLPGAIAATREENGGIDTSRFLDWWYSFVDDVEPLTKDGRKVLLIYDSYRAHLSAANIELLERNNINVYVPPAHTSGKTQPLNVVLFLAFKNRLQTSVRSCAAPGIWKEYDILDLFSLLRDAYFRSFTTKNIQPLDPGKLLNTPRPRNGEADTDVMSVEELYTAFKEKQVVLRNAICGAAPKSVLDAYRPCSHFLAVVRRAP